MSANRDCKCDTVLPRDTLKKKSRLNEEEENTGIRFFDEPAPNLAIRHTMTSSSRKQRHCCCSNNSTIATQSSSSSSSSSSSGGSTLYTLYNTDSSITQTTPQSYYRTSYQVPGTYFHTSNKRHGANKKKVNVAHTEKNAIRDSNH